MPRVIPAAIPEEDLRGRILVDAGANASSELSAQPSYLLYHFTAVSRRASVVDNESHSQMAGLFAAVVSAQRPRNKLGFLSI